MSNLTRAHQELFRWNPDQRFPPLAALMQHCQDEKKNSIDRWELPQSLQPAAAADYLQLGVGNDGDFLMNDWSFGQLCKLASVKKNTMNRLSPDNSSAAGR